MAVIVLNTGNFLTFAQTTNTNIKWFSVGHTLGLGSTVQPNMFFNEIVDRLWFQQVVGLQKILNLSAGNSLGFSQATVPRSLLTSAESGLPIAHWADVYKNYPGTSFLSLSQEATCEVAKYNPSDVLVLTQAVSYTITKNFEIESVLVLNHGASVYLVNKNFIGPYPEA